MRDALGLKSFGRSPGPVPPAFAERYRPKENMSHHTSATRLSQRGRRHTRGPKKQGSMLPRTHNLPSRDPHPSLSSWSPEGPYFTERPTPSSSRSSNPVFPGPVQRRTHEGTDASTPGQFPASHSRRDPTASKGRDPHQHREEQFPSKFRNTATNIKKTLRLGNGSP